MVLQLIWLGALQNLSILLPVGCCWAWCSPSGACTRQRDGGGARLRRGPVEVYVPVACLAVVVTVGLAWLTLVLAPQATERALSLRNAALRAGQFAPIAAGKFRTFGGGSAVVYAEDVNADGTLQQRLRRAQPRLAWSRLPLADRARHSVTARRTDSHDHPL